MATTRRTAALLAAISTARATTTQAAEDAGTLSTALWTVGVGMPVAMGVMAVGIFAVTKKHKTIGYSLVLTSLVALLVGISGMVLDFGQIQSRWW